MPTEMPDFMRKEILDRFNKSFEIKCKSCVEKDTIIKELIKSVEENTTYSYISGPCQKGVIDVCRCKACRYDRQEKALAQARKHLGE